MDQARVEALAAAERKWFRDGRPRSMEATSRATGTMPRGVPMSWMDELYDHPPLWVSHGAGSRFWDLDGHEYVDMYVADMSAFCGHAAAPVVRAVCERAAAGASSCCPPKTRWSWPRRWRGGTGWPSGSSRCRRRKPMPRLCGSRGPGPAVRRSSCSTASALVATLTC